MRAVVQRVRSARVEVGAEEVCRMGEGLLALVGVARGDGVAESEALARRIGVIEDRHVGVHRLDIRPYRDDRDRSVPLIPRLNGDIDVTDRAVILVDDVLFTGRTARAALDAVIQYGRPRSIQLVVLIDRGHREYPIQPDYVGRTYPTKHKERVIVEVDEGFVVYIEE